MNKYDSDTIRKILLNKGYTAVSDMNNAQLVLINTCAIREKAEEKALSTIGRLAGLKKQNPDMIAGVIGCVAQEKGAKIFKKFPFVDLMLGPRNIYCVDKYISKVIDDKARASSFGINNPENYFIKNNRYLNGKVKSFLKIMEGCDNFCSYCIVPFVRGRETSVPADQIISEVKYLVMQGIKEITLIGQNVNSYNVKNKALPSFADLLKAIDKIDGLSRLRFVTSHPKDLSDRIIDSFGKLKSLCSHIHLPVQSGSDRILKLMNRQYSVDYYNDLVVRLKKTRPDISITSDIIVGFPGETESDFEDTLKLMDKVEFDNIFSFKYSERSGTKALELSEKVGEEEKQRRLSILQEKQKKITLYKNRMLEGTIQEILVEGHGKKGSNQFTGRTLGNKVVNFFSKEDLTGETIEVLITGGCQNSLRGELAKKVI